MQYLLFRTIISWFFPLETLFSKCFSSFPAALVLATFWELCAHKREAAAASVATEEETLIIIVMNSEFSTVRFSTVVQLLLHIGPLQGIMHLLDEWGLSSDEWRSGERGC